MTAEAQATSQPPQKSNPKIYYTCVESKIEGPFSLRELVHFRNERKLRADTLCCIEGAKEWQPLEVMLTHKLGKRRMKRVPRSSLSSFSQRTLPTLTFIGLGLLAGSIGTFIVLNSTGSEIFGFGLIGVGFALLILAYFLHPKSE